MFAEDNNCDENDQSADQIEEVVIEEDEAENVELAQEAKMLKRATEKYLAKQKSVTESNKSEAAAFSIITTNFHCTFCFKFI